METYHSNKKSHLVWWIILGLFITAVIALVIFIITSKTALHKRLNQMREEGLPTTFAELEEYCKLPADTQNAADLYQQAFTVYVKPTEDELKLLPSHTIDIDQLEMPLSNEIQTAINDHLTANKDCLDLLYQAAEIKDCHFPFQYSPQGDILLMHLSELRNFMRLLTCQMTNLANDKDSEKIITNLITQAAVADSLKNEPILISHLVRIACWSMLSANMEYALNNCTFSKDQLLQIQSLLPDLETEKGIQNALLGEQCFMLEIVQNPDMFKGYFPSAARLLLSSSGLADKNCLKYLDLMKEYRDIAELQPKEKLDRLDIFDDKVQNLPLYYILLKTVFPALNRVFEIDLRYKAAMTNARTALAVEQFILDNKTLPQSLDKLVGNYLDNVPVDLDGNPLRYTVSDDGYTVYSVNFDLKDNNGLKKDKENSSKPHDIPFTVVKKK